MQGDFGTGIRLAAGMVLAMLLVACGDDAEDAGRRKQGDAALSAALDDPIMVEPDLGVQDQSGAGLTAGEHGSSAVPPIDRSAKAVEAARDEAKRLSGGKLATAPSPESGADDGPALAAVTAEQLTAALPGTAQTCLGAMQYGMVWAARLPVAVMPYPRSNGLEAAGVERADCHLRSARFVTPVGKQDVLDFYHARLRSGGQSVSHREVGGAHLLTASSATAGYLVRVRELDDGLVEVAVAARN